MDFLINTIPKTNIKQYILNYLVINPKLISNFINAKILLIIPLPINSYQVLCE